MREEIEIQQKIEEIQRRWPDVPLKEAYPMRTAWQQKIDRFCEEWAQVRALQWVLEQRRHLKT